jgi:2-succinyl-6-hydroxy-2,4-cyclohexadiene-1-carboxylate synthase
MTAPSLVLIHGFLGEATDWDDVIGHRPGRGAIHALDLPGHGARAGVPPPRCLDDLAAETWRELPAPGPVDLCGYSLGGRLALAMALCAPDRVASLVLISTSFGLPNDEERRCRAESDDQRAERLFSTPRAAWLEDWYAQPVFASLRNKPELLARLIARRLRGEPAGLAAALRNFSPGREPSRWHCLESLRMPVLLVAGMDDEAYVRTAERGAELIHGSRLEVIRGAGHAVHLEQPGALAKCMKTFLTEAGAHR